MKALTKTLILTLIIAVSFSSLSYADCNKTKPKRGGSYHSLKSQSRKYKHCPKGGKSDGKREGLVALMDR